MNEIKTLVVDDSSVNLTIAEGILKGKGLEVTLSESGKDAVRLSKENKYDLILIDHLMPEMDGVETLKHIKEDADSQNKETLTVALTANEIDNAKEYYTKLGFDDYLSKPIDPDQLAGMLGAFFSFSEETKEKESVTDEQAVFINKLSAIDGLNGKTGLENLGSFELFSKVLSEFADTGAGRADAIETFYEQGDYRNYTIQVHALKSAARIIGATGLSNLAAALEQAGNEESSVKINNATGILLEMYRDLTASLQNLISPDEDLPLIEDAFLKEAIESLKEMIEGFDFDSADYVMAELKKYRMPDSFKEKYLKLKTLMAEVARDDILNLLENI